MLLALAFVQKTHCLIKQSWAVRRRTVPTPLTLTLTPLRRSWLLAPRSGRRDRIHPHCHRVPTRPGRCNWRDWCRPLQRLGCALHPQVQRVLDTFKEKNACLFFSTLSLCLSRACLGKMIILACKMVSRKLNGGFLHTLSDERRTDFE